MGEYQEVGNIREQPEGWPAQGTNGEFIKGQADFEGPFRYLKGNIRETVVKAVPVNEDRSREPR